MLSTSGCGAPLRLTPMTRRPRSRAALATAAPMSPTPMIRTTRPRIRDVKICSQRPYALIADDRRHPRVQHQQHHHRRLARLLEVHAAVVGKHNMARQPVERRQRLYAGTDDVNPTQSRCCLGQPAHWKPGVPHDVVRRHESRRRPAARKGPSDRRPGWSQRRRDCAIWPRGISASVMRKTAGLLARVSKCM